jgi:hypothetical protein
LGVVDEVVDGEMDGKSWIWKEEGEGTEDCLDWVFDNEEVGEQLVVDEVVVGEMGGESWILKGEGEGDEDCLDWLVDNEEVELWWRLFENVLEDFGGLRWCVCELDLVFRIPNLLCGIMIGLEEFLVVRTVEVWKAMRPKVCLGENRKSWFVDGKEVGKKIYKVIDGSKRLSLKKKSIPLSEIQNRPFWVFHHSNRLVVVVPLVLVVLFVVIVIMGE